MEENDRAVTHPISRTLLGSFMLIIAEMVLEPATRYSCSYGRHTSSLYILLDIDKRIECSQLDANFDIPSLPSKIKDRSIIRLSEAMKIMTRPPKPLSSPVCPTSRFKPETHYRLELEQRVFHLLVHR